MHGRHLFIHWKFFGLTTTIEYKGQLWKYIAPVYYSRYIGNH